ncbi:hypothetical protein PVAP13_3NG238800 [Panicum virgatum]|uniref:Uncharacterized protein n=1 Tax=Panicum virgatum TaxID=38727 RepID=A0A8T0UFT7_PANVG|nr:hypothetical protein PVAP13_3NG238800 [Panicum virgatum]
MISTGWFLPTSRVRTRIPEPSGLAGDSLQGKKDAAPPPLFRPALSSRLRCPHSVERHHFISIPVSLLLRLFPNSMEPHHFPVEMLPRRSTSGPPPRPAHP